MTDAEAFIDYVFGEGSSKHLDIARIVREQFTPPLPLQKHVDGMGLVRKGDVDPRVRIVMQHVPPPYRDGFPMKDREKIERFDLLRAEFYRGMP